MLKSKITYKVCVSFVDDSYWDDGSRWTNETFNFNKRKDAIEFVHKIMNHGYEISGRDSYLMIQPKKKDIVIYRNSVTEIKW